MRPRHPPPRPPLRHVYLRLLPRRLRSEPLSLPPPCPYPSSLAPAPSRTEYTRTRPVADRVKHVPHDMRYYFRAASTPTATPNAAARTTVVDECRARPTTDGGVEATGAGTYFEATADAVGG